MIDFIKAKNAFSEYLKQYDVSDGSIKMKIKHTYEVIYKSEYIARALSLEEEDIELAKLIALLHDIGRFEQIKETKDFSDNKSFDHADYGGYILFNKGFIRNFIEDHRYDEIIKTAIINHNKYQIESGLDEKVLLHCKIIRDADKLDNFRVKELERFEDMFPGHYHPETIHNEEISDKVYEDFKNHKCIKIEDRKTCIDCMICVLAFIFDFNFDISLKYIKENHYINKLMNRFENQNKETVQRIEEIRKISNDYIENHV